MLYNILVIVLVVDALFLVALILLQQGKGADAGAAFGSGSSGTVFGAAGSANFLSRSTAVLATIFFALALAMAYLARHTGAAPQSTVLQAAQKQAEQQAAPSAPAAATKAVATPAPAPGTAVKH
jgi:preprotein translocase subunit SecG